MQLLVGHAVVVAAAVAERNNTQPYQPTALCPPKRRVVIYKQHPNVYL
jgi:hypothetical protein